MKFIKRVLVAALALVASVSFAGLYLEPPAVTAADIVAGAGGTQTGGAGSGPVSNFSIANNVVGGSNIINGTISGSDITNNLTLAGSQVFTNLNLVRDPGFTGAGGFWTNTATPVWVIGSGHAVVSSGVSGAQIIQRKQEAPSWPAGVYTGVLQGITMTGMLTFACVEGGLTKMIRTNYNGDFTFSFTNGGAWSNFSFIISGNGAPSTNMYCELTNFSMFGPADAGQVYTGAFPSLTVGPVIITTGEVFATSVRATLVTAGTVRAGAFIGDASGLSNVPGSTNYSQLVITQIPSTNHLETAQRFQVFPETQNFPSLGAGTTGPRLPVDVAYISGDTNMSRQIGSMTVARKGGTDTGTPSMVQSFLPSTSASAWMLSPMDAISSLGGVFGNASGAPDRPSGFESVYIAGINGATAASIVMGPVRGATTPSSAQPLVSSIIIQGFQSGSGQEYIGLNESKADMDFQVYGVNSNAIIYGDASANRAIVRAPSAGYGDHSSTDAVSVAFVVYGDTRVSGTQYGGNSGMATMTNANTTVTLHYPQNTTNYAAFCTFHGDTALVTQPPGVTTRTLTSFNITAPNGALVFWEVRGIGP